MAVLSRGPAWKKAHHVLEFTAVAAAVKYAKGFRGLNGMLMREFGGNKRSLWYLPTSRGMDDSLGQAIDLTNPSALTWWI